MAWTDESRAKAVELYKAAEPTPENSIEIVKDIAEQIGETANSVRSILSKAGVYVKKDAAKATSTSTTSSDKAPRVSKEAAHKQLSEAIEAAGGEVDTDIVSKLTGKAAMYFAGVIAGNKSDD